MNQINTDMEFVADKAVSAGKPAQAAPLPVAPPQAAKAPVIQGGAERPAAPRPTPSRSLHDADLRAIQTALTQGDDALARRKDLGELHKRLVTMMTTVQQGLGEAQAAQIATDRAALVTRLDQVERAVNSMEGALRIELEPMLRASVQDMIAQSQRPPRRVALRSVTLLIAIVLLLVIGAAYSAPIQKITKLGTAFIATTINSTRAVLSPNGGISTPENHID